MKAERKEKMNKSKTKEQNKKCCTCEYYVPAGPESAKAFPKCEYGGTTEQTCDRYREKGTVISRSMWADWIREKFGKTM